MNPDSAASPERRRAVALGYQPGVDNAPRVLATGEGELAARILELAARHGVQTVDDPALARALAQCPVGMEVPPELYRAIAEILAYVYRLKGSGGSGS